MKQLLLICAAVVLVGCGESSPTVEIADPIVEKAIREELEQIGLAPTGQLTEADLEKVTRLSFFFQQLTDVKGLEKLTQLKLLDLTNNQLTNVKGLEKLTKLTELKLGNNQLTDVKVLEKLTKLKELSLDNNPALTKAQIDQLQKALPSCKIYSSPTK